MIYVPVWSIYNFAPQSRRAADNRKTACHFLLLVYLRPWLTPSKPPATQLLHPYSYRPFLQQYKVATSWWRHKQAPVKREGLLYRSLNAYSLTGSQIVSTVTARVNLVL